MINANNIKYQVLELLHENKSTRLYKCEKNNKEFIIKAYRKNFINRWQREINVFNDIKDYTNIIRCVGWCANVKIYSNIYHLIILEHAKYGDLFEFLTNNKGFIKKETIISIFSQILNGVKALHSKNWYHRDLKLENIVISNLNPIRVKIIDFEFSTQEKSSNTCIGTISYMSPQMLLNFDYDNRKNDIWTLGVLFFCMYTGVRPYSDPSPKKNSKNNFNCNWLEAIREKNWVSFWLSVEKSIKNINNELLDKNNSFPSDFKNMMESMLAWNEKDRSNLNSLINHNFIKQSEEINKCCTCNLF
tara:strand:- start:38 stop:946 length:909 start_codon:yes stop_codon:yes gene_type:complete